MVQPRSRRWSEFKERYCTELENQHEKLGELAKLADGKTVTLIYGAKDEKHNNAVALKAILESL